MSEGWKCPFGPCKKSVKQFFFGGKSSYFYLYCINEALVNISWMVSNYYVIFILIFLNYEYSMI